MTRNQPRNMDRIQHESVRRVVDQKFYDLHDALEEAWYGDRRLDDSMDRATGAKAGIIGRLWNGIEITTKEQFDELHGLLWHHHTMAIFAENVRQGNLFNDLTADTQDKQLKTKNLIIAAKGRGFDLDAVIGQP